MLRTEPAPEVKVLGEERVGRYRVQVYRYPFGDRALVYRVLVEEDGFWRNVRHWSRNDERSFPKRAARVGSELVKQLNETK